MSNNGKVTFYNDIAFTGLKENNIEVNNTQQLDNNGIYFTSKDKIVDGAPAHITQGSYIYTLGTHASIDGDKKLTYFNKSTSGGHFPTFESVNLSIVSNISTDHFAKTLTYSVTEFNADEFISQYNKLANFANNLINTDINFSIGEYNLYFKINNEGIVSVGTSSITTDVTFTVSKLDLTKEDKSFTIACTTGNNIISVVANEPEYFSIKMVGSSALVTLTKIWGEPTTKNKEFTFTIEYAEHIVDGKKYPAGTQEIKCTAIKADLNYSAAFTYIPSVAQGDIKLFDFKINDSLRAYCNSVVLNDFSIYYFDSSNSKQYINKDIINYYLTTVNYEKDDSYTGFYVKYNNDFGNQIGYYLPNEFYMDYNSTAFASTSAPYCDTVIKGTSNKLLNNADFKWRINYNNANIDNTDSSYYFGTKHTLPNLLDTNDNEFKGWYSNSSYTGNSISSITVGNINNGGELNETNHTHNVYAKWEAIVKPDETAYYWYVGNENPMNTGMATNIDTSALTFTLNTSNSLLQTVTGYTDLIGKEFTFPNHFVIPTEWLDKIQIVNANNAPWAWGTTVIDPTNKYTWCWNAGTGTGILRIVTK